MAKPTIESLRDSLEIIWTIAAKDIVDALKNKLVISLIIMVSLMLLLPKMLPLIFEEPQTVLPVYDLGGSPLAAKLESAPGVSVQKVRSEQELKLALCGGLYPEIGLLLPVSFDQGLVAREPVEFQGYVCWGKRYQVSDLRPKLEGLLSQALDQPVSIQLHGNLVYPPSEGVLTFTLAMLNSVLMILMMGIFLVPSLLFEEKESRTMLALLVSPASIGQVVIGKALAGLFYILVTAVVIFTISWADVTHWEMVLLFVIGGGCFSVAVGLVMGSFFKQQIDMVGWMTILLLALPGAVLIRMLDMKLPALVESMLPWVPSVALAELCRAAFAEIVPAAQVWTNLGIVLGISLPLYALVIWKVRRSDR